MNCQKCRASLRLDQSLVDLNPAAYDLLVGSNPSPADHGRVLSRPPYPEERKESFNQANQHASSSIFKRTIPPPRQGLPALSATLPQRAGPKDNTAMSFVMLTDSQLTPGSVPSPTTVENEHTSSLVQTPKSLGLSSSQTQLSFSRKIEANTRLFEILSSRSDIDHPICSECTELLLSSLQARLSASTKERDAYISFLKELKNNVPTPAEVAKAEANLAAARSAEEEAFSELLKLEKEVASLEDESAALEAESRALDEEEEEFWRSRNAHTLRLTSFQATRDALNASYDHDTQQLERLQRTNVYNDTFCIGHDGNFGTINGLRLGRLQPPNNVEWPEINAAWGTTALLLATVADKLGFAFRGYKIKPMGSTSHIERYEPAHVTSAGSSVASTRPGPGSGANSTVRGQQPSKPISLELFSSGDLPLGRTILHRRFNDAMVAFLECLRQLGDFVENGESDLPPGQQSGGLKLPYRIEKDKIGGLSIKLGISQDEAWTNACKYTLTCCKFLLAHASNIAGSGGSRRHAS